MSKRKLSNEESPPEEPVPDSLSRNAGIEDENPFLEGDKKAAARVREFKQALKDAEFVQKRALQDAEFFQKREKGYQRERTLLPIGPGRRLGGYG